MQRGKQVGAQHNGVPEIAQRNAQALQQFAGARNHERLEAGVRILTSFSIGSLRGVKANLERAGKVCTREE